jgi:hypothetical protein
MPKPKPKYRYGSYDSLPCRWTDEEAWILYKGMWREISPTEAVTTAAMLTAEAYLRNFGHRDLPPLPSHAFRGGSSDALRAAVRAPKGQAINTRLNVWWSPLV